jgi:hypothetical protein
MHILTINGELYSIGKDYNNYGILGMGDNINEIYELTFNNSFKNIKIKNIALYNKYCVCINNLNKILLFGTFNSKLYSIPIEIENYNKELIDIKCSVNYFVLLDINNHLFYYGYIGNNNCNGKNLSLQKIEFNYKNDEIINFICLNNYICILSKSFKIFLYNETGLYNLKIQDSIHIMYQMKSNIFLVSYDKKRIHVLENNDINNNFQNEFNAKTYQINDKLELLGVCENYISNSDEIIFLIKGNPIFQYENNENIFNLLYSINCEQGIILNKSENQNKFIDFNLSNESIYPVNISLTKINNNSNSVSRINKISSLLIRVFDSKINEIKNKRARSANRKIILEKVIDKTKNKEMKKSRSNNILILNNKIKNLIKENNTDLNYNSITNQSIHLVEFNIDKPNNKLNIPINKNKLYLDSIIKLKEKEKNLNITKENNFNYLNEEQKEKKLTRKKRIENIRKSQDSDNFISKFFENSISSQNNILKKENNCFFNSINNKTNKRRNSQNSIYNQNSNSIKFDNNLNDNKKLNKPYKISLLNYSKKEKNDEDFCFYEKQRDKNQNKFYKIKNIKNQNIISSRNSEKKISNITMSPNYHIKRIKDKSTKSSKSNSVICSPKHKIIKLYNSNENSFKTTSMLKSYSTNKLLNNKIDNSNLSKSQNLKSINKNNSNKRSFTPLKYISNKNISIIPLKAENKQKQILLSQNKELNLLIDKLKEKYINYLQKKFGQDITKNLKDNEENNLINDFINNEIDNEEEIYNLMPKNIFSNNKEIKQYLFEILKYNNLKEKLRDIDNSLISENIIPNKLIIYEEEEEKNSIYEPIELDKSISKI